MAITHKRHICIYIRTHTHTTPIFPFRTRAPVEDQHHHPDVPHGFDLRVWMQQATDMRVKISVAVNTLGVPRDRSRKTKRNRRGNCRSYKKKSNAQNPKAITKTKTRECKPVSQVAITERHNQAVALSQTSATPAIAIPLHTKNSAQNLTQPHRTLAKVCFVFWTCCRLSCRLRVFSLRSSVCG